MKKNAKIAIAAAFLVAIGISFWAGHSIKQQEYLEDRAQRCQTLISFAIDKAENNDISDPDVMEALISNLYAACQFCDKSDLSGQLHDLWNALIFDGDCYIGKEDLLITQLKNINDAIGK